MTISSGSLISSSDLNTLFDGYQSTLTTEIERTGEVHRVNWDFYNPLSSTSSNYLTLTWVVPDDCKLVEFGFTSYASTGTPAITVALTGSVGTLIENLSLSGTHSAADLIATRYYSDTTKPYHTLLKGSILTVTVTTTASSGTTRINPWIMTETFLRRS